MAYWHKKGKNTKRGQRGSVNNHILRRIKGGTKGWLVDIDSKYNKKKIENGEIR